MSWCTEGYRGRRASQEISDPGLVFFLNLETTARPFAVLAAHLRIRAGYFRDERFHCRAELRSFRYRGRERTSGPSNSCGTFNARHLDVAAELDHCCRGCAHAIVETASCSATELHGEPTPNLAEKFLRFVGRERADLRLPIYKATGSFNRAMQPVASLRFSSERLPP